LIKKEIQKKLSIKKKNCAGLEELLLFHTGTEVFEASP